MSIKREDLPQLSDEKLVDLIISKPSYKVMGMDELITRYIPILWHYVVRLGPTDIDPSEVVADTIVFLADHLDKYKIEKGGFRNWISGVAKNKLSEARRKQDRYTSRNIPIEEVDQFTSLEQPFEKVTLEIDYKEAEKKVLEAVMKLPEIDRTLYLLKINYDLSYEEIAVILNRSVDQDHQVTPKLLAVKFYRMMNRLRNLLRPEE